MRVGKSGLVDFRGGYQSLLLHPSNACTAQIVAVPVTPQQLQRSERGTANAALSV